MDPKGQKAIALPNSLENTIDNIYKYDKPSKHNKHVTILSASPGLCYQPCLFIFWRPWLIGLSILWSPFSTLLHSLSRLFGLPDRKREKLNEDIEQCKTPAAAHPTVPSNYSKDTTTLIIPGLWMREVNPDLADDYFHPPANTKADNIYVSKGVLLDIGGTAYLERPPSGEVIKTPIPDPDPRCYRENCRDMRIEARVYKILGDHPQTCCIRMEYVSHGNLKEYMLQNEENVSHKLRLRWARQAAE
ncbi:hypothetical protein MGYG_02531 [Nannizzia gypsea CBS 118893]|uniref:Protein kinase domain-containing protein n=1 Tax=Arthroderma gypseum (strain ATCC MYA-4604 / CBS 118893) TaxID=535722 RepID=E4UN04_ARTGP|nr:hypothetical protein MGYG_02531 [Nannizzia gypsea CBS 118893]EFQ99518.1 hypothetical protein MGYG_02531 [Nannizzia gypsea CBS 118893]